MEGGTFVLEDPEMGTALSASPVGSWEGAGGRLSEFWVVYHQNRQMRNQC